MAKLCGHTCQYANTRGLGSIQMETILQRPNHIYQFIRGDKWKKTSFILLPLFDTCKWSASLPFCACHSETIKLFSWGELFEIMCVLPVRLTTDLTWLRVAVEMHDEGVCVSVWRRSWLLMGINWRNKEYWVSNESVLNLLTACANGNNVSQTAKVKFTLVWHCCNHITLL